MSIKVNWTTFGDGMGGLTCKQVSDGAARLSCSEAAEVTSAERPKSQNVAPKAETMESSYRNETISKQINQKVFFVHFDCLRRNSSVVDV